jgi:hypothetical protein
MRIEPSPSTCPVCAGRVAVDWLRWRLRGRQQRILCSEYRSVRFPILRPWNESELAKLVFDLPLERRTLWVAVVT